MHFKRWHITIIKGNLVFFQNIKITANLLKCLKPCSAGEFTVGRLLLLFYFPCSPNASAMPAVLRPRHLPNRNCITLLDVPLLSVNLPILDRASSYPLPHSLSSGMPSTPTEVQQWGCITAYPVGSPGATSWEGGRRLCLAC